MSTAFFHPITPEYLDSAGATVQRWEAAEACIGPWSPSAMHGGPPSSLLVRACERAARAATGLDLASLRASVDFLAPVPVGQVEVSARVLRSGRRVTLAEARLATQAGEVMHLRSWLLRTSLRDPRGPDASVAGAQASSEDRDGEEARMAAAIATDPLASPPQVTHPGPDACPPAMTDWAFPYARAIEWRHVSGDPGGPGDAAAWARQRLALVEGEQPSGMQRAVMVADSGNGISAALDWGRWSFVNVDLTVHLSRRLEGEWVLLDARTRYEPGGTGLATSVLFDDVGVVGAGAQALLISPRSGER